MPYELRVDGKSLRIDVDGGNLAIPSASSSEPDLIVEADADLLAQLLMGELELDNQEVPESYGARSPRRGRRMFRIFRFPSAHPA